MRKRRDGDELALYRERLRAIEALDPALRAADDDEVRARVAALRERVAAGAALDELLVEAFALVREAAQRALGLRPFDEQLAGGIALHEGKVVEMPTGEGKTLAAVAPVFLAALAARGVHVLTFNDYLARRDALWMGPVYELLGVSVGFVQEGMEVASRRRAYACDVTYVTAKEAGFDVLRDGLCFDVEEQVHRPFHLALVDEADSILVDDARNPLVIAGAVAGEPAGLARLADVARHLEAGRDFDIDEHGRNIFLTGPGSERVEAMLGCGSLFDAERTPLLALLRNALHAEHLLHRDVDYIVRGGAIELVDELTGRVADDRQWPDGLQAALEAKEGVRLGADGQLLGSITLQHFLQLYPRLCGMTATAQSAAEELREVYGLEVTVIPPHRPAIREDLPHLLYSYREARDAAVVAEIAREHGRGRPVLVGSASVAASERLAARLGDAGIACQVLNAKNDEQEAAIVAEAGTPGAVTISTNMAGRGTDVRLGGKDERERERVVPAGGLYVVGTNLHESVRIDRQLRGRAGRQGDPGASRFFLALDDPLLRRYGIATLLPANVLAERGGEPIEAPLVRREVARAQRIAEGELFDARRRLYQFSEILERQRRYLADWRQDVLAGRAEAGLLAERAAERWHSLRAEVGEAVLAEVERKLTLLTIDRCWSDYLAEMQALRDEVHLVLLGGKEPLTEFYQTAISTFEALLERIDEEVVAAFLALRVTAEGVDWEAQGFRRPGATWTYIVNDRIFASNLMLGLSSHASIGLWGTLLLWPLLFVWGLYLHWRRRRGPQRP